MPARFDGVAHQERENPVCLNRIVKGDAKQDAFFLAHRRVAELLSVHLGEPFVARDVQPTVRYLNDVLR